MKYLKAAGLCLLTAAFVVSFLWSRAAMNMAQINMAFNAGNALSVCQMQIQPERTGNTMPSGAIEAIVLEHGTAQEIRN